MTVDAFYGVWVGHTTNQCKQNEDSARVGINRFITAVSQMSLFSNAIHAVQRVQKASSAFSKTPLSWKQKAIFYITPIITNTALSKISLKEHPTLKKTISYINSNLGSICNLAVTISSIALIALGQSTVFGVVSLSFMIIGYMQRRCYMPVFISKAVSSIGFVGSNISRVLLGGYLSKAIAALEIANFCYSKYADYTKVPPLPKSIEEPSAEIPGRYIIVDLEINQKHLTIKPEIPKAPDIDLNVLQTIFDKIDLNNPKLENMLLQTVKKDEHWLEFHSDKDSNEDILKYVKKGLTSYINNIKNRKIKSGEIFNYSSLIDRSKHITKKLLTMPVEDQITKITRLSLASYYCPAGYLEQVRAVFYTVCDTFDQDTIQGKTYQALDYYRRRLFQMFMHQLFDKNPVSVLADVNDIHTYNEFLNLLGDRFCLAESKEAREDALSYIDIATKKLYQYIYKKMIDPFIEAYNSTYIIDSISEAINNGQIPFKLVEPWFIEEYKDIIQKNTRKWPCESIKHFKNRIDKKVKDFVHENVYDIETGEINTYYVGYFLMKMGILKA
jgi:hypothetical protein